jgi:hypothetical protein
MSLCGSRAVKAAGHLIVEATAWRCRSDHEIFSAQREFDSAGPWLRGVTASARLRNSSFRGCGQISPVAGGRRFTRANSMNPSCVNGEMAPAIARERLAHRGFRPGQLHSSAARAPIPTSSPWGRSRPRPPVVMKSVAGERIPFESSRMCAPLSADYPPVDLPKGGLSCRLSR